MTGMLHTARLLLRPTTQADRLDLYSLEQDREVMRYLNGGVPTPLITDLVANPAFLMPRGGEPGVWAVHHAVRGQFMGWVSLDVDGDTAALGYRFHREFWGHGYATEAAAALIKHAFLDLGLTQISAETMAVNFASRRLMERLGMRYVETFFAAYADPLPGSEAGEVEYVITRQDWDRSRST